MTGLEILIAKGLLVIAKSSGLKMMILKFASAALTTKGILAAVGTVLAAGMVVGGVKVTADIAEHANRLLEHVSEGDHLAAGVDLTRLVSSVGDLDSVEALLGAAVEDAELPLDTKKLLRAGIEEVITDKRDELVDAGLKERKKKA
jgi:hypothetical protein